nr:DNA mismatch repair protein [Tanacetum cinerariifolium]
MYSVPNLNQDLSNSIVSTVHLGIFAFWMLLMTEFENVSPLLAVETLISSISVLCIIGGFSLDEVKLLSPSQVSPIFALIPTIGEAIDTCQVDGFLSKSGYGSRRNIVPTNVCDVNVTPDKRKIIFTDEGSLLMSLKEALLKIYSLNLASFSFSLKQVSTNASDSKKEAHCEKQPQETLKSSPVVNLVDIEDYSISKKDFTLKAYSVKKDDTLSGIYSRKNTTISNKSSYNLQVSSYNSTVQKNVVRGTDSPHSRSRVQSLPTSFVTVSKKHESIGNTLSEVPILRNGPTLLQSVTKNLNSLKLAKSLVNHHVVCGSDKVDRNESKPLKRTLRDEDYDVLDVSPLKVVKDSGKFDEDPITIEKPAPVSMSVLDPTSPKKTVNASEDPITIEKPAPVSMSVLDPTSPKKTVNASE